LPRARARTWSLAEAPGGGGGGMASTSVFCCSVSAKGDSSVGSGWRELSAARSARALSACTWESRTPSGAAGRQPRAEPVQAPLLAGGAPHWQRQPGGGAAPGHSGNILGAWLAGREEAGAAARAPRRAARAHPCPSAGPWWTAGARAPSGPAARSGAPPRPAPACWRPAQWTRRQTGASSSRARRPRSRPARSPRARPPRPAAPRRHSPPRLRGRGQSACSSLPASGITAPPQQCTRFTSNAVRERPTRQSGGAGMSIGGGATAAQAAVPATLRMSARPGSRDGAAARTGAGAGGREGRAHVVDRGRERQVRVEAREGAPRACARRAGRRRRRRRRRVRQRHGWAALRGRGATSRQAPHFWAPGVWHTHAHN